MPFRTPRPSRLGRRTTVPVMSPAERHSYRGLTLLWLGATVAFSVWWFQPSHVVSLPRFLITTFVIAYALAMPAYFLFFVGRMRRPNPALTPPTGLRVAFATTFVPGAESIRVLERTITAMRDQEGYTHDVWVLDEGDEAQVRDLCRRVGAHHFSRKGKPQYQQRAWPFKARTKAGNYNSWLDWLEERGVDYDVLLQIAIGDGAASFAEAMVQEYQWARALTQVLLKFFPRDGLTLPPHLWLQFLFADTWYPLFALSQAIGWSVPVVALLTDQPWVRASY